MSSNSMPNQLSIYLGAFYYGSIVLYLYLSLYELETKVILGQFWGGSHACGWLCLPSKITLDMSALRSTLRHSSCSPLVDDQARDTLIICINQDGVNIMICLIDFFIRHNLCCCRYFWQYVGRGTIWEENWDLRIAAICMGFCKWMLIPEYRNMSNLCQQTFCKRK